MIFTLSCFLDIVPEPQELLGGVVFVCFHIFGFYFPRVDETSQWKKKWRTVLYQSVPFASIWD
jgi:hypothetical protein